VCAAPHPQHAAAIPAINANPICRVDGFTWSKSSTQRLTTKDLRTPLLGWFPGERLDGIANCSKIEVGARCAEYACRAESACRAKVRAGNAADRPASIASIARRTTAMLFKRDTATPNRRPVVDLASASIMAYGERIQKVPLTSKALLTESTAYRKHCLPKALLTESTAYRKHATA
jgi:hypothetical protein